MKKMPRLFYALSMTLSLLLPWSLTTVVEAQEQEASAVTAENPMLARLQLKEKRLNAELKSLDKNDPDFLILSQSIRDELTVVRQQIQNVAASAKPSAFSELGPMVPEESAMTRQQAVPGQQALPSQDTLPTQGMPQQQNPVAAQASLPVGPVNLFAQIKEELSLQLKQVQQMQQSIGRQDGRLATMLQGQEKDILNQLREVDRQITEMNAAQGLVPQTQPSEAALGAKTLTTPDQTSASKPAADGVSESAAGSSAAPAAVAIPPKATYSWAPVAGNDPALSASRDPFAAAPSPEVLEIKKMVTELKEEMTKLQAELTAINTQLRLLSFRVAGTESVPAANPSTDAAKPGTGTAVKSGEATAKPVDSNTPVNSNTNADKK